MENHKLVDKLKNETNISYEEAKIVLEKSNWDILDAFVYLEDKGKVQKPSVSIFYTNECKENYKYSEVTNKKNQENNFKYAEKNNTFEGIFVAVCKIIDTCNNIFFEIKRENKVFLRIPVTVIMVLIIFAFWIVIPLYIVGLFFDLEFSLSGNRVEINKINHVLKAISENIKKVKDKLKRGI
ncbi:ubiquitin [Clostridium sp.]|uniref:ubiquitin n=1 Tax=Clostridium sp. TaxID=1506 RepID=UPI00284E8A76|nr:ubiquitin [Clostridium sp.]MDR3597749.1 ubiquitin [Clostridium sp.]